MNPVPQTMKETQTRDRNYNKVKAYSSKYAVEAITPHLPAGDTVNKAYNITDAQIALAAKVRADHKAKLTIGAITDNTKQTPTYDELYQREVKSFELARENSKRALLHLPNTYKNRDVLKYPGLADAIVAKTHFEAAHTPGNHTESNPEIIKSSMRKGIIDYLPQNNMAVPFTSKYAPTIGPIVNGTRVTDEERSMFEQQTNNSTNANSLLHEKARKRSLFNRLQHKPSQELSLLSRIKSFFPRLFGRKAVSSLSS